MKLVVVGGSSQSTPAFVDALRTSALSRYLELVLIGQNRRRLEAVVRASRCLAGPAFPHVFVGDVADPVDALRGADVILLQARYGGLAARAFDETFPLRYGIPGDEGLGPGGLASAWRSWPEIQSMLSYIEKVAPAATVLCMTAPLGILTRCALQRFPQIQFYGLCELPYVTLRRICDSAGASWRAASFSYAGVNHCGWFDAVEVDGRDLLIGALSASDSSVFPSRALVETSGGWPLHYWRLHYERDRVLMEQRRDGPRGLALERLAEQSFHVFETGTAAEIRAVLAKRPAPWYVDAVVPALEALAGEPVDAPLFVTARNDDYLPDAQADEVVEIPCRAHEGTLQRDTRSRPLPQPIFELLRKLMTYERLAAGAVLARSRSEMADALAVHPWSGVADSVDALGGLVCDGAFERRNAR